LIQTRLVLLLLGLATLAGSASAVSLTDVRVGVHGDHTRIVLETDAKAPYIVDAGEKEIIVHVDAAATAEAVTAKSPHLIWAKVEPTPIGADVRLQLKQPADVKAMVLTGPDRIVLDLYPKKTAAAPLPAPELIAEEEPAEAAGAEPPPDEPGVAAREEPASEVAAAGEEAPAVPAQGEIEAPEGAEGAPGSEEAGREPAPGAGEGEPAPEGEEPAAPPPEAEEFAGAAEPAEPPAEPSEAGEEGGAEPQQEAAAEPERPTTPIAPAPSGGLFGSPYLLAAVAVALFVVFVFLRRRLRSADRLPPLPADEDRAPFPPPAQRAVAVDVPSARGESLFDVEAEAIGAPPKDDDQLPSLRRASADAGDENERRIAHLERRIEELVDARERLERQVAAQTEELRVQRAAIARTQRVLRTVAPRGEEEPSGDTVKG
jgi:hypothetical protein